MSRPLTLSRPPMEYRCTSERLQIRWAKILSAAGLPSDYKQSRGLQPPPSEHDLLARRPAVPSIPTPQRIPAPKKRKMDAPRLVLEGCLCPYPNPSSYAHLPPPYLAEELAKALKSRDATGAVVKGTPHGQGRKRAKRTRNLERDQRRSAEHKAKVAEGAVEVDKSVLHDTKPQSTGFAGINTHPIPKEDIKPDFKSEAQLDWEKVCSGFTFLPYVKEGRRVYSNEGRLAVYIGAASAERILGGYRTEIGEMNGKLQGSVSDGLSKRGVNFNRTFGTHSQQQGATMGWAMGRELEDDMAEILRELCETNKHQVRAEFPTQARWERPSAKFGVADLACANGPPREIVCDECGLPDRQGAAATHFHLDSDNDVNRVCMVTGAGKWSRYRHCLVFLELQIIVELPPGVTAYYGSSLWVHGNINLADHLTDAELLAKVGEPYTRAMNAEDAKTEVRWSIVTFSQGSTRRTDVKENEWWTEGRADVKPWFMAETDPERVEIFRKLFEESWPTEDDLTWDVRSKLRAQTRQRDAEWARRM